MSFKRFEAEDLVIASEAVSAPVWSTGEPILGTFFTSSTQPNLESGKFYFDVFQTGSTIDISAVQFSVAYADLDGSGSSPYNSAVIGRAPSSTIYGQYRNLVLGDEESSFSFGGVAQEYFYAIAIDRDRFKESLLPASFNLTLKNTSNKTLKLTDNSANGAPIVFNDAGRVYQVVSGSDGVPFTGLNVNGFTATSGSYGLFLPDIGVILLNGAALDITATTEGVALGTTRGNTDAANPGKLFQLIKSGSEFQLNNRETVTSQFVFARVRNSEFNYSTNPSYITGSGDLRISSMLDTPQTYITSVGMYNDNNELLAVAKLSRPLLKDFTKEALIRIKLDF